MGICSRDMEKNSLIPQGGSLRRQTLLTPSSVWPRSGSTLQPGPQGRATLSVSSMSLADDLGLLHQSWAGLLWTAVAPEMLFKAGDAQNFIPSEKSRFYWCIPFLFVCFIYSVTPSVTYLSLLCYKVDLRYTQQHQLSVTGGEGPTISVNKPMGELWWCSSLSTSALQPCSPLSVLGLRPQTLRKELLKQEVQENERNNVDSFSPAFSKLA